MVVNVNEWGIFVDMSWGEHKASGPIWERVFERASIAINMTRHCGHCSSTRCVTPEIEYDRKTKNKKDRPAVLCISQKTPDMIASSISKRSTPRMLSASISHYLRDVFQESPMRPTL